MKKIFALFICFQVLVLGSCSNKMKNESIPSLLRTEVVIKEVREVEKTIEYVYSESLVPEYCRWYGGIPGGLLTTLTCMFWDLMPERQTTRQGKRIVYQLTLNNGEIVYSKNNYYVGKRIDYDSIGKVKVVEWGVLILIYTNVSFI